MDPASPGTSEGWRGKRASRSISRVLSWTIIHLRQVSPPACSDLPESTAGRSRWIPIWSCSGWGLPSPRLLPAARCALTAPFHPYPAAQGKPARTVGAVSFLLHFPWAHAPQVLPGTLPCGARTFLYRPACKAGRQRSPGRLRRQHSGANPRGASAAACQSAPRAASSAA